MKLYGVQCLTGKEIRVMNQIGQLGYCSFVPRELTPVRRGGKWQPELRLLMPSYLFVELGTHGLNASDYFRIARLPEVIRILGLPDPLPLEESEAEWIRLLSSNGKPLEPSQVSLGQTVKVVSGPLLGREGEIVKLDPRRRRASIVIETAGVRHRINLGIDILSAE